MSSLLFAKILSTVVVVLGLSAIAERAGPTLAGILAGVPLGMAIIFFLFGIQQGPEFVSRSASYALGGLGDTVSEPRLLAGFKLGTPFALSRGGR